jgi:4-hydroxybenzoate polyprenyltransferase
MVPVALLFVAFCLISSCVYLFNDVRDREEDRRHPTKCRRPIASGQVSVPAALVTAVLLGAGAFALVLTLDVDRGRIRLAGDFSLPAGFLALLAYLVVNVSYTALLKNKAIADVTCVALGFLIRVVSGPAVVGLEVSPWLVLCTFFGALFLALAKRRGELMATQETEKGRKVLKIYSAPILDILLAQAVTATLVCYAIYTVSDRTVEKFGTTRLMYTIPIVFAGLGRYLMLLYRRGLGEDPAAVLFTDRGILLSIVVWLVVSGFAIGF